MLGVKRLPGVISSSSAVRHIEEWWYRGKSSGQGIQKLSFQRLIKKLIFLRLFFLFLIVGEFIILIKQRECSQGYCFSFVEVTFSRISWLTLASFKLLLLSNNMTRLSRLLTDKSSSWMELTIQFIWEARFWSLFDVTIENFENLSLSECWRGGWANFCCLEWLFCGCPRGCRLLVPIWTESFRQILKYAWKCWVVDGCVGSRPGL